MASPWVAHDQDAWAVNPKSQLRRLSYSQKTGKKGETGVDTSKRSDYDFSYELVVEKQGIPHLKTLDDHLCMRFLYFYELADQMDSGMNLSIKALMFCFHLIYLNQSKFLHKLKCLSCKQHITLPDDFSTAKLLCFKMSQTHQLLKLSDLCSILSDFTSLFANITGLFSDITGI